jgi:hypothetical protein
MLENLQYVSIVIEVIVAILGLMIAFQKKKNYGYGIFLTFAIYVFYDLSKQIGWSINSSLLYVLFFIASISALWAVYIIYNQKKK